MQVKKLRGRANISQKELALLLNVERSTIAKWETGKSNPRAEMLPKLANILGCTIDELMREDEQIQKREALGPFTEEPWKERRSMNERDRLAFDFAGGLFNITDSAKIE